MNHQVKINKLLRGINSSYNPFITYGRVLKISLGMVLFVVSVCTPFTNLVLFPLSYKYKNKELFRISLKEVY